MGHERESQPPTPAMVCVGCGVPVGGLELTEHAEGCHKPGMQLAHLGSARIGSGRCLNCGWERQAVMGDGFVQFYLLHSGSAFRQAPKACGECRTWGAVLSVAVPELAARGVSEVHADE